MPLMLALTTRVRRIPPSLIQTTLLALLMPLHSMFQQKPEFLLANFSEERLANG